MKAQRIADLYSDYLLASFGATTATGLSELLEGEISHDQVTRYLDRKSTRLNSSHIQKSRMPSSA